MGTEVGDAAWQKNNPCIVLSELGDTPVDLEQGAPVSASTAGKGAPLIALLSRQRCGVLISVRLATVVQKAD